MPEMSGEIQKTKHALPRQWGCFKLLLIPMFLFAACYGGMWVFARYGGEWAMSQQVPIPPESQQVKVSERSDYSYFYSTKLYFHTWTPDKIREAFLQGGLKISPIPINPEEGVFFEYDDYYGNRWENRDWNKLTPEFLHYLTTFLTLYWREDAPPFCPEIRVYKSREAFLKYYPDMMLPDGMSAFEVTMCWRDIQAGERWE